MHGSITVRVLYLDVSAVIGRMPVIPVPQNMEIPDEQVWIQHRLGELLTKTLLKEMSISPTLNNIRVRTFGKPFIPSAASFNISHSKDLIVCAAASQGEIGVDIEYKRPLEWQQYRNSFSSPDWQQIISASDPSVKLLEFWTKKESVLKADGRGLQVPLSSVTLNEEYATIGNESKRWYFRPASVSEGYFCHVCTEFPAQHILVKEIQDFGNP
jgi:4'-phosphopantetheinyl transferase